MPALQLRTRLVLVQDDIRRLLRSGLRGVVLAHQRDAPVVERIADSFGRVAFLPAFEVTRAAGVTYALPRFDLAWTGRALHASTRAAKTTAQNTAIAAASAYRKAFNM